jgi:hypothetical protein
VLGLLLLGLAACDQRIGGQRQQERIVPLRIVEGPAGAVLAFVPVFIRDQGPFLFALDTGASQSVIDQEITQQLNLPIVGRAAEVVGIVGVTEAPVIALDQWRAGDVPLPETAAITIDLPAPRKGEPIRGLLGSDVLSTFGAITVDYEQEELVLRARR